MRRAAEDKQINLTGEEAIPECSGVPRSVNVVAVKLEFSGYSGVCQMLTVEEQNARITDGVLKRAGALLVIVGQRSPSRTEEGHTRKARTDNDP
ncbi:MAG TPA: hypothetical protein VKV02_00930 [Acidobacteriaceae bacterium]|nr:hypothetical protein [Acidobacteriaceae bacterium]